MMDGTIRQTYYDDKQRGRSDSPHIPVQKKSSCSVGGQRASSFRFGSTRPIVAMEEEAVSQAAEGVTHGTDSHVLISDEWFALKTARRAVFALCSMHSLSNDDKTAKKKT